MLFIGWVFFTSSKPKRMPKGANYFQKNMYIFNIFSHYGLDKMAPSAPGLLTNLNNGYSTYLVFIGQESAVKQCNIICTSPSQGALLSNTWHFLASKGGSATSLLLDFHYHSLKNNIKGDWFWKLINCGIHEPFKASSILSIILDQANTQTQ